MTQQETKSVKQLRDEKMSELFDATGTFFAFSNKQFEKAYTKGVKYVSLDGGMYTRKDSVTQLIEGMEKINTEMNALDLEVNGVNGIIRRELFNHECFYTGELYDCIAAVAGFGITAEQVREQYNHIRRTEDVD